MAPLDHSCDVSPFCRPARAELTRSQLPLDLPWRWVHLGPIEPRVVPVVEHRCRRQLASRRLEHAGGLGRFTGYHLDLLGTDDAPPDVAARWHAETGLWVVYAVAHRVSEGVGVVWRAERAGPGVFRPVGIDVADPVPDLGAIVGRCIDLLLGRALDASLSRHVGRPRGPSAAMRARQDAITAEAEAIKTADPRRSWASIAASFYVDERTLRTWRRNLRARRRSAEARATDLRRSS